MSETIYSKSELRRLCVQASAMMAEKFSRLQDHMLAISKSWQEKCDALREEVDNKDHDIKCMVLELYALREEVATHQREIERLESIVARGIHTCHKDCALDGCVNRRLSEENERLKYELEALDGLANEKHDKLSAQLAEAEKVLSGCTSANCRVRQHAKGGYGTANVCQCPEKAREFLAKAKP